MFRHQYQLDSQRMTRTVGVTLHPDTNEPHLVMLLYLLVFVGAWTWRLY